MAKAPTKLIKAREEMIVRKYFIFLVLLEYEHLINYWPT